MNVPEIARKTYEKVKLVPEFKAIFDLIMLGLEKIASSNERAKFVHQLVDNYNADVFSHPLVKELSPCKSGCSACCYTQVSVTDDEAALLALRIKNGVRIDMDRLATQVKAMNSSDKFYSLKYDERKCVFLNDEGKCVVYEDRPSVCRTNAVIGNPSQCDTSSFVGPTRLVKTEKSDVVIYASFVFAKSTGALPFMVSESLKK